MIVDKLTRESGGPPQQTGQSQCFPSSTECVMVRDSSDFLTYTNGIDSERYVNWRAPTLDEVAQVNSAVAEAQ